MIHKADLIHALVKLYRNIVRPYEISRRRSLGKETVKSKNAVFIFFTSDLKPLAYAFFLTRSIFNRYEISTVFRNLDPEYYL